MSSMRRLQRVRTALQDAEPKLVERHLLLWQKQPDQGGLCPLWKYCIRRLALLRVR